ncbi:MAG TPA: hypothetical protein VNS12_01700 [Pelagibacterium sp.]|uniref:hypothetical protein n=1 Tax=Pelagibacterium sp. TaxID=1967288 RepID=UPI002B9E6F89|nr:hypothetical protein [Pelagibacterium sp.]HWJ86771.1 hypothetical protein [Pelagibacterium sp.]
MKPLLVAVMLVAAAMPAYSQSTESESLQQRDQKLFVMGGRMGQSDMGEMFNPFTATYEDTLVFGAGYQRYFFEPFDDFKVGLEVGAALRVDEQITGEGWAGIVGRYDGWVLADRLRLSPSLVFGGSVVTQTIGVEAEREANDGLPGDILFYLSPEISLSTLDNPNSEVFWRLQHRSGAWNTFGGGGTANATMLGIRTSF